MVEGRRVAERRRRRPRPPGVVTVRNAEAVRITGGAALVVVAAGLAFAFLANEPWGRTWAAGLTAGVGLALSWHTLHRYLAVTAAGTVVVANGLRGTVRLYATEVVQLRISTRRTNADGYRPVELVGRDGRTVVCWGYVWDTRYLHRRHQIDDELERVAAAIRHHGGRATVGS
jgi:hypothetical protein